MKSLQLTLVFLIYPLFVSAQWKKINISNTKDFYGIYFNGANAYAAGFNGALYKSTDSGKTWQALTPAIPSNFRAVYFTSPDTGFICGENVRLQKTTDSGKTWTQKHVRTAAYAYGMAFQGKNGLIVGKDMLALRSTDHGENWLVDTTFSSNKKLNSVCITPSGNCWAVGDSGYILHKRIEDKKWTNRKYPSKTHFNHISFVSDSILYISGGMPDSGTSGNFVNVFLLSMDSGKTWNKTSFPEMKVINSAVLFDKDTGFFVGSNGIISKSYQPFTKRGLQLSGQTSSLNAISFSNGIGLIVGDGGLILRTTNLGGFGLDIKNIIKPELTVFPNPGNGLFKIESTKQISSVICVNAQGQNIPLTAINTNGEYELNASGLFFLSIQFTDGSAYNTKVLIR